jgi:hypothetical protein
MRVLDYIIYTFIQTKNKKYSHTLYTNMGLFFTDKFSLLHLATGIVAYYWSLSFLSWSVLHLLFEIGENTTLGMKLINHFTFWPGGKDKADSFINSLGDQFYASIGWAIAYFTCQF